MQLWRTDGATLQEIRLAIGDAFPMHFASVGETLYFAAKDNLLGRELWKSDLLGTQGTFPSGESLTAVERGISAVAGERGDDWKDPLEDAMRLAFAIKARAPGNSAAATSRYEKWAAMTGAEAAFRNPETKSESQHVDAVTKKKDLDVPRRQLWSELGYSQQQVLDWEAELAAAPPEPSQPVIAVPVPPEMATPDAVVPSA